MALKEIELDNERTAFRTLPPTKFGYEKTFASANLNTNMVASQ